eukprot:m.211456 g.211456  ORF g.211456 m.211456 type:complete len:56 (+) comp39759_c0_seq55:1531-1698(+)
MPLFIKTRLSVTPLVLRPEQSYKARLELKGTELRLKKQEVFVTTPFSEQGIMTRL